jgi:hypothetical protein
VKKEGQVRIGKEKTQKRENINKSREKRYEKGKLMK